MRNSEIDLIVEALLFVSPEPLTQNQVNLVFDGMTPDLQAAIKRLTEKYDRQEQAFEIVAVAGGYQLQTKKQYDVFIRRLLNRSGQLQLSQAALETLAIVAYRQPISRFGIESIRGVDSTAVLKTLLSKTLIKIKGRGDGPGRPLLYATTDEFLQGFGLNDISDLPKLKEISDLVSNASSANPQIDAFK
ncbi:MAG: SMC-Scp complex subunit ScpB [Fidelibacterota bacterium]